LSRPDVILGRKSKKKNIREKKALKDIVKKVFLFTDMSGEDKKLRGKSFDSKMNRFFFATIKI
jgi:hypothetical protein